MSDLRQLQARLEQNPGDWDLRAELVEALTLLEDLERARELVRNSPDEPVPYHIQKRFWKALSPSSGITVEGNEGAKPLLKAKAKVVSSEKASPSSTPDPLRPSKAKPESGNPPRLKVQGPRPDVESSTFKLATVDEEILDSTPRSPGSRASTHVSAFSIALFIHLLFAVGFSAIAWRSYSLLPAHITVIAPPAEEEAEIKKKKIIREVEKSQPAAPSQAGTSLITADVASPVVVPTFENLQSSTDFNVVDAGLGISQGLSFEAVGVESAVNFFGIQSGGQSIVFVVDATRYMLLDEKGGMYAYDKVKQEISSMLVQLNRGTAFNLILYEGNRLRLFRPQPVRALPSTVRKAIAWLDPLNRDYGGLGLGSNSITDGVRPGAQPIAAKDIAHYAKGIQAALEQEANAIFCISSGWRPMARSLSPEDQARLDEARARRQEQIDAMNLPPAEYNPKDVERWRRAQEKAREWLRRENEERSKQGLPPKVVIDFGALVRKLSPGASPPRRIDDPPDLPPLDFQVERQPPYTPEEVEEHIRNLVLANYGVGKLEHPAINMVLFLGTDESLRTASATADFEKHFLDLTRKNKGKLKVLQGLAALENVTDAN